MVLMMCDYSNRKNQFARNPHFLLIGIDAGAKIMSSSTEVMIYSLPWDAKSSASHPSAVLKPDGGQERSGFRLLSFSLC